MILELYSIKDNKMGHWMAPMIVRSIVEVTRNLTLTLQQKDNLLSQFPMDYSLYSVGKFDQDQGQIIVQPNGPTFVADISQFITK